MNMFRFTVVLLALGLATITLGASLDEIRQLIDQEKYGEAVLQADKMLNDRQVPAQDHYDILMLKGEAALRANQKPLAVSSFRAATRQATDRAQAIAAASNAILVQRSNDGALRLGDQKLDIVKPDDRKLAMQKLADNILANQARQVQTALDARTLDPILAVLPDVYRMYVLETQATDGNSTVAEPLARRLGTQAHDLIADELRRLQREIIYAEQTTYTMEQPRGWYFRGLIPAERTTLEERNAYIERIRNAVIEIRRLAATLRVNVTPWDALVSQCDDLQQQIDLVLSHAY